MIGLEVKRHRGYSWVVGEDDGVRRFVYTGELDTYVDKASPDS